MKEKEISFGEIVKINFPDGDFFFMPTEEIAKIISEYYSKSKNHKSIKNDFDTRIKQATNWIEKEEHTLKSD